MLLKMYNLNCTSNTMLIKRQNYNTRTSISKRIYYTGSSSAIGLKKQLQKGNRITTVVHVCTDPGPLPSKTMDAVAETGNPEAGPGITGSIYQLGGVLPTAKISDATKVIVVTLEPGASVPEHEHKSDGIHIATRSGLEIYIPKTKQSISLPKLVPVMMPAGTRYTMTNIGTNTAVEVYIQFHQ